MTVRPNPAAVMARLAKPELVTGGDWARWRADPEAFAMENFGVRLWDKQIEIIRACFKRKKVACRSGHKIGKSLTAAVLAVLWVGALPRARVVMTSSSARQVEKILWLEVRQLFAKSKRLDARAPRPDGRGRWEAMGLPEPGLDPETGIVLGDGRFVVGFTASSPERMAGTSSDQLLYIADEASGIEQEIAEAIEGNCAGGGHILMLSNPTRTSGWFYDAFHRARAEWQTFHVSALDTPNVRSKKKLIPGLAVWEWVEQKRQTWGERSAIYQVRVMGNFPSQGDQSVISLALVEVAKERGIAIREAELDGRGYPNVPGQVCIGVDPARFGPDHTALVLRRGQHLLEVVKRHGIDSLEIVGEVVHLAENARRDAYDSKPRVYIDVTGGYGAGAHDILQEEPRVEVYGVTASAAADAQASDEPEFANGRAQLWWGMKRFLEEGGSIPPDCEDLEADLVAPEYRFDARGRILIESKDDLKKRLGRSPDVGDAACLAVRERQDLERGPPKTESEMDDWAVSDGRWGAGRGY